MHRTIPIGPFVRGAFEGCSKGPTRIDPMLASPNIKGGDLESYEKYMDGFLGHLNDMHHENHGAEFGVFPVVVASEPKVDTTAHWGRYWEDSRHEAYVTAFKIIDEIKALKRSRN